MNGAAVGTRWNAGNLEFLDKDGAVIATWDGANRKLTFPAGASLEVSDATLVAALTGAHATTVANANAVGGLPIVHRIDVADAATGNVDVTLTHKTRVIDAWAVKVAAEGGAANTVQLMNGASAITDAMSINISDQAVVRASSIDDARHEIAAGGTLRVARTKAGGNAACVVYVLGVRVA